MNDLYDVLIIGSGGAGLSAALSAKEHGAKVAVLSKTYPTHSQTCQAQGGINAAINGNKNSVQAHISDTLKGAHGLGKESVIEYLCNEAPKTIKWLDKLGVPFSRDKDNQIAQRKFGAASEIRTCYSSDYTGLKILHTLYDNCIKESITFFNEFYLLELLVDDSRVYGAEVLNIKDGEITCIYAKSIILATGGYGNLYHKFTTNTNSTTGDGIIAALNAGCELSNMEMIQFHPTAMEGNNILISESARGEGGYLVDKEGNRFIDELKARDEVARAIYEKISVGEQVYLDLRHIPKEEIIEFMPQEYRLAKEFMNIQLDKELLPINPAAHYTMGGIKVNVSCETNITNLFACGECAQNSLHGANRLGGNSLQEIVTFGKVAGENAATKAKETKEFTNKPTSTWKERIEKIYNNDKSLNFYTKRKEMGKLFFKEVGLFREESRLNEALSFIRKCNDSMHNYGIQDKSRNYNKNLIEYLEFKNLVQLGEIVIKSALERKESRGAHFRSDYLEENITYQRNSIAVLKENKIYIDSEEIS